jgi:hypothetical protein
VRRLSAFRAPVALFLLIVALRGTGCRKKTAAVVPPRPTPKKIFTNFTPPPPRPTLTMPPGITRVPTLPE